MKLITYIEPGPNGSKASYGAIAGERVIDLAAPEAPNTAAGACWPRHRRAAEAA